MQWLNQIVDEIISRKPTGEIIVSSGVSPSGQYHVGTLREVLTADAVLLEIRRRGRKAKHLHFVDDHDRFRKIPVGIPKEFEKYLGMPLRNVPSPDPKYKSYADYYLNDFESNIKILGIDVELIRTSDMYDKGVFSEAIEKALENIDQLRRILEKVSGRHLDENWSPIQIVEDSYLKKRVFVSLDKKTKTITYKDSENIDQTTSYENGNVKLDWRTDWPARWWIYGVDIEPFGREHATKGGSYDTGKEIVQKIFGGKAPLPVPYDFINRSGDTKKMSKSEGNTVTITEILQVLPPEIVRFFVLRYATKKLLFFDQTDGVVRLIDDYAELLAKPEKSPDEEQIITIVSSTIATSSISNVPFSHLVASYQSALKDSAKTIEIIKRTEHGNIAESQKAVIEKELVYIDKWLKEWASENVKFELAKKVSASDFNSVEAKFLRDLADKISLAPKDADGEWFHEAMHQLKQESGLEPKELFGIIYRVLIQKTSGPRAGWFLSILPRAWLIARLKLKA